MIVNLNGVLLPDAEARISVLDHGLLYGDGLFETLRVYAGRLFRVERHLRRLRRSAAQLALPVPWSDEKLEGALRETLKANQLTEGAIRLTLTRGQGLPVPDPAACEAPSLLVTARVSAPPDPAAFERGLALCSAGVHPRTFIPGVKSLSYLPFQQARVRARERGFDEGLLTDGARAVETSVHNLFLVRDGELWTPDLRSGCLPGIARGTVLELAGDAGLPRRETAIETGWLAECEEAFVTNSFVELLPVVRFEEDQIGDGRPGPLFRRLRLAYRELVESAAE